MTPAAMTAGGWTLKWGNDMEALTRSFRRGFKEELQKGGIVKIGGSPPKALSGCAFLRTFPVQSQPRFAPGVTHRVAGPPAHSCRRPTRPSWGLPPPSDPPGEALQWRQEILTPFVCFYLIVTTRYIRFFTERKTEAQRNLCQRTTI